MSDKKKIAILGGGVGAMAAAFALTETEELRSRFEVTVHQMGWRLGGKGASGRNREIANRIEEHGLHVWLGFYENAFRLMRSCYEALGRAPGEPLATMGEAFRKQSYVVVQERLPGDEHHSEDWRTWTFDFPTNNAPPGAGGPLPSLWSYLEMVIEWLLGEAKKLSPYDPLSKVEDAIERGANEIGAAAYSVVGLFTRGMEPDDVPVPPAAPEAATPEPPRTTPTIPAWIRDVVDRSGDTMAPIDRGPGIGTVISGEDMHDDFTRGMDPPVFESAVLETLKQARDLVRRLSNDPSGHGAAQHHAIIWLLRAFNKAAWLMIGDQVETDFAARKLWIELNLAGSVAIGFLADGILYDGWDGIDDRDFRAWLAEHGANHVTLDSGPVRAVYDLVFGYEGGDTSRPALAAGTAMRGVLRMMFTYKGAIFWEMQAGMGDAVFAPFYRVLKDRGVKFEFFHEVRSLCLSADGTRVARIDMTQQARLAKGVTEYDPLMVVNGLPSWPSAPLHEQLEDGARLAASVINFESAWSPAWDHEAPLTLERGRDFDDVVLAISIGGLPSVCPELIAASPAWRDMLARVKTVQTCALQLWLSPDLPMLGWSPPYGIRETPVMTSYVEPLDTWADMTHLLPRETWPEGACPRTIAYFCGPFIDAPFIPPYTDTRFPDREKKRFEFVAVSFLNYHVGRLWPGAARTTSGESFKWEMLVDFQNRRNQERLESQYLRVNIDPSERYVLSLPGSTASRLRPDGSGFANLYLAGDWTANGINAGCVEAATISGLMAARAITGIQQKIPGESDF